MGMGNKPVGTTAVDLAAMRTAAERIDAAAATLFEVVRVRLGDLRFDSAGAGRAHAAAGAALRAETERLAMDLICWAQAAGDVAAALRAGAAGMQTAESDAAAVLR